MKTNFHTHTYRCQHAIGEDVSYVKSAIVAGIATLGFADHTPWPFKEENKPYVRMELSQLNSYLYSLYSLRDRYKDEIEIKIGLECENFVEFMPWLSEIAKEKELDYLIFGNHFPTSSIKAEYFGSTCVDKEHLDYYCETALKGMEYKNFAYFAHPDLFMRSMRSFDENCVSVSKKICEKAAKLNLPLEFNIAGYQMSIDQNIECYPHDVFWKIAADSGCTCIIGFDAHKPEVLERQDIWDRAVKSIKKLGLKRIETFDFLK